MDLVETHENDIEMNEASGKGYNSFKILKDARKQVVIVSSDISASQVKLVHY